MIDGQWALFYGDVFYAFGTPETPVFNRTTPEFGGVEIRSADSDRARSDGRAFGKDLRSGQTITFDLGVRGSSEITVRDEIARFSRVWRADPVRLAPGAVAELRVQYAGRERSVYGRPRRFSPALGDVTINNFATIIADFAAADDLFYAAADESVSFGVVPALGGGLVAPLTAPLSTTLSSDRSQGIRIVSEEAVWPIVEIVGPITNPAVSIGPDVRFEARLDLLTGERLVIDTRPWARSALRNGTANVAGALRGTRLSKAALPPGTYDVGIKGLDPTGTSTARISWRPTFSSL